MWRFEVCVQMCCRQRSRTSEKCWEPSQAEMRDSRLCLKQKCRSLWTEKRQKKMRKSRKQRKKSFRLRPPVSAVTGAREGRPQLPAEAHAVADLNRKRKKRKKKKWPQLFTLFSHRDRIANFWLCSAAASRTNLFTTPPQLSTPPGPCKLCVRPGSAPYKNK